MKPKYVKCKYVWHGSNGSSIINKIYNTNEPNEFSIYTWEQIYKGVVSKPESFFIEVTEEEWNKQEYLLNNNYQIY